MNTETTKAQVNAAMQIVLAIADTIKEVKEVPSGHLYARLMGKLTLEDYNGIIRLLINSGVISLDGNHVIRWEADDKSANFEAPKVEPFKAGDNVTFTPDSPRNTKTTGLLVEQIKNTSDAVGWHILAPLPGDPGRIVRVWAEDGKLTKTEGCVA